MALNANRGDGDAGGLELFDERDSAVALGLVFERVVVVVELRLGIGLVGKLEGLDDEVVADDFEPL